MTNKTQEQTGANLLEQMYSVTEANKRVVQPTRVELESYMTRIASQAGFKFRYISEEDRDKNKFPNEDDYEWIIQGTLPIPEGTSTITLEKKTRQGVYFNSLAEAFGSGGWRNPTDQEVTLTALERKLYYNPKNRRISVHIGNNVNEVSCLDDDKYRAVSNVIASAQKSAEKLYPQLYSILDRPNNFARNNFGKPISLTEEINLVEKIRNPVKPNIFFEKVKAYLGLKK